MAKTKAGSRSGESETTTSGLVGGSGLRGSGGHLEEPEGSFGVAGGFRDLDVPPVFRLVSLTNGFFPVILKTV